MRDEGGGGFAMYSAAFSNFVERVQSASATVCLLSCLEGLP